ncbi:hypothetical protein ACN47E_009655 [Coniothyrium glycines]
MEGQTGITVYNLPPQPALLDGVGIFYITFCAIWTSIVAAGMLFCWVNRHLPILRVRGLPLAFGSVISLHVYWILAQLTYPVGRSIPAIPAYSLQYFVMSTWFPLGIALFHAANLRFLRVAKLQKQFAQSTLTVRRSRVEQKTGWLCKFRNMEYTRKVMMFITVGVVVQTFLAISMWIACKKYHPSFGIAGTEIKGDTLLEQLIDLGRGWEWWPSVVWQFFWTWGVAPVLIYKSWAIRDTMGWRAQTIGACLSGLHATPMFLISSYVPAFYPLNAYFHPSQWIHLNTMFIEIFLVFIPAYQVVKHWAVSRRARDSCSWETASQTSTIHVFSSKTSAAMLFEGAHDITLVNSPSHNDSHMFSLSALDRVLSSHPTPLQEFSAYNDFSGENIAFLTRVNAWKAMLPTTPNFCLVAPSLRLAVYNAALQIYICFISPRDAEFPLNLSSNMLKSLESVFEAQARSLLGMARIDPTAPFSSSFFDDDAVRPWTSTDGNELAICYTGPIPMLFDTAVFDEAVIHVKDLVLTNTWPKFVKEMQARRGSAESERSKASDRTWKS